MKLGGVVPFTTIDFPQKLSAVLFCQGCPWNCSYCHNPALRSFSEESTSWDSLLRFLDERRGFLDAVVFSGGEPLIQEDLLERIQEVCSLGFAVGLHTSGVLPERLERILPYCDWIGMDLKAPFPLYRRITGRETRERAIRSSAALVISGARSYEFRTTTHPKVLSADEILLLAEELSQMGGQHYALQRVRLHSLPGFYDRNTLDFLTSKLQPLFRSFELRL